MTDLLNKEFKECVSLIIGMNIKKIDEVKNTINEIIKTYAKFINDPDYVYKKCRNNLIVVMKKIQSTVTNENRLIIYDELNAKFRANEFEVTYIFSLINPLTIYSEAESIYLREFKYVVGQIVKSKYDNNIDIISTDGIHYYKDIKRAYYHEEPPPKYTGIWKIYNADGSLWIDIFYENGKYIVGSCVQY